MKTRIGSLLPWSLMASTLAPWRHVTRAAHRQCFQVTPILFRRFMFPLLGETFGDLRARTPHF